MQDELKRNQQLQQQLLRKTNQVLISDDTIDLNKTSVSNLILGGEIIDINDLSDLKNKNKYLNENLMKTINENKQFKERETELNDTMTKLRVRISELEMKTEGIDPDTYKKENNVLNNMKREYDFKELKMQDRVKDLESKLKFYVETQELIDVKNQKINELEEQVNNLKDKKGNYENKSSDKENASSKNKPASSSKDKEPYPKTKKEQKTLEKNQNMDLELMNKTLKEQNIIKTKKIEELQNKLEETEQSHIDKIRQLRQENNIRNMALLEKDNDTITDKNEDELKGRELLIN